MTDFVRIMAATAAGGALGAVTRFAVSTWVGRWAPSSFPWGTFVVNISGCLALGLMLRLLEGGPPASAWRAFLIVGVAGGFTTFSTFSHENVLLLQQREYGRAALYMSGSMVLGISALLLGLVTAGLFVQRA